MSMPALSPSWRFEFGSRYCAKETCRNPRDDFDIINLFCSRGIPYFPLVSFGIPGRDLRSAIETQLAMFSGREADTPKLIAEAEWLGKRMDRTRQEAFWLQTNVS